MNVTQPNQDLLRHISASHGVSLNAAHKIVEEIASYFTESCDEYIQKRHKELQGMGISNPNIYRQIHTELKSRRFPSTVTSERQIRRIIYG